MNTRIKENDIHPLAVNWMITYRCLNKCDFCLTDSSKNKFNNELSCKQKLRTIEVLSSLGVKRMSLMGGEPFILDELEAISKCASLNGVIFNLTTSGLGCSLSKLKKVKNNLQYLNVSLDGREFYHDKVRGTGSFKLASKAVKDADEAGIPVRIYNVLTTENHDKDSIEWIFKFAKENEAFLIMFIFMSPTGRANNSWHLRVEPDKRADILKTINHFSSQYDVQFKSCDPYLPENYKMFVEADGFVYKHSGMGDKFPLGDIIDQPGGDFWFNLTKDERAQHWNDFEGVKKLKDKVGINKDLVPEGMEYIPPGTFWMGSDFRKREQPVHEVYLDGYFIDKYQVSNKQYAEFLNSYSEEITDIQMWLNIDAESCLIEIENGIYQPKKSFENYPVVEVSWYGAIEFAKFHGKRLPTEAEWEKAALGGSNGKTYPWGESLPDNQCNWLNYDGKHKDLRPDFYHKRGPLPVGLFPPNEYGLYDMAGNVWEWCSDWHNDDYYKKELMVNPQGPENGKRKILKGGCWSFDPVNLRIANRSFAYPEKGYIWDGFRCVVSSIDIIKKC